MYSNQEAFDLVVEKLVAQGEPAMRGEVDKTCVYFAYNGNRCAAGHLVPANLISKVDDWGTDWSSICVDGWGTDWNSICTDVPEAKEIADQKFILALQNAHDFPALNPAIYYNWRTGWVSKMREVATDYRLDLTKLDELATEEWQKE